MAPRRFIETEETFHFFNDEVVLGTNEIRSGDVSSSSDDSSDDSHRRRAKRRRRAKSTSSMVSRLAIRRRSQLLSVGAASELARSAMDGSSDSEDAYDSLDEFELEEQEEEIQLRERKNSVDIGETETQNIAASPTKQFGVGVARFEHVFEPFRDLYMSPVNTEEEVHSGALPHAKTHTRGHRLQFLKARRAIATFTRRVHCANSYRYRKQSEFMRVCYLRALEGESGQDSLETTKEEVNGDDDDAAEESDKATIPGKQTKTPLLTVPQKDDAVETTVPVLYPRKWPHLPYRNPLEWHNDVGAAIEFLSRLAELPATSLLYEPIDVHRFEGEVNQLLELSSQEHASESPKALSESAVSGLLGLFGVGVQLQSFSLLSSAVLQFIRLGQATRLGREGGKSDVCPQLQDLLELYCSRLAKYAAKTTLAATYSRDLSAQWKVNSYQPSTSDAIATDGLYLYIFGRSGLLKIGTGNGTTVRDFVYAHNKDYARSRDAERSWLCCIGDSLYCRTIVMPGHRVDRIRTCNLNDVQELFLAPNRALIGKGITESSVYAMVTDGIDLYTIRCIDTYKRPLHNKSSSNRKHKSRSHKARKSTPVSEIVSAVLGKSNSDPRLQSQTSGGAAIQVGDRVVRGPDWKWSNQDGDKGSPGIVERISTWGGVKGSGVTVRWDKNQRVNTYRWGAEGCYDLYIVVEKDGQIVKRKPLPSDYRARQTKGVKGSKEGNRGNEGELLPRHQFVLYRHKVDDITSIMSLEEPEIDLFLDLTPWGGQQKQSSNGESGTADVEIGVETLSALHSHTVALCTSKTSWMCDGGMSNCFGDNSVKRYRCTSGCDYDLCESCLFATVIDKTSSKTTSEDAVGDDGTSNPIAAVDSKAADTADVIVQREGKDAALSELGVAESSAATIIESTSSESVNPFSTVDTSLFDDSETEASLKKKVTEANEKRKHQTEEQLVKDLTTFWCGLYSRKECQVALRRNGMQLTEASIWLHTCGAYLRDPMVIPTVSSVVLAAKPRSGALDPVLLIAGTFYATLGQLCVVSPPGLYTVDEGHSDMAKRAASSCDASWFFSLQSGTLLASKPVLLKGIPAGSPTCVDVTRKRLLVFSGYLNCLEEYVDHVQQNKLSEACMPCDTLAGTGKVLLTQLAQLMRKRAAFPAYKHPRAGLQDILFRTEREPASSDKQPLPDGGRHKDGESVAKSKGRRIKNIRARLKELDRLCMRDQPGHFIPFCVDFEEEALLRIFREITCHCTKLSSNIDGESDDSVLHAEDTTCVGVCKVISNLLCILTETVQEFEFVGVAIKLATSDEITQRLLQDTEYALKDISRHLFDNKVPECVATDAAFQRERSEIVLNAHFLLVWGIRKGIFCSRRQSEFFVSMCEMVLPSLAPQNVDQASSALPMLPDSYFALMLEPQDSMVLRTKRDCDVNLLRRLLCSPMDDGRIAVADFVPTDEPDFSRFLEIIFALSKLESSNSVEQEKWMANSNGLPFQTPVSKALHCVLNYCCAQMYAVNIDPEVSIEKAEQEMTRATSIFERFARECFDCSLEMLHCHQPLSSENTLQDYDLQSSVVGTLLPLVVAFIPNFPDQFSVDFRDHLSVLMKALDKFVNHSNKSDVISNSTIRRELGNDAAIFGGYQVVETPHPYNHNQPVFRRVVHIPGASVLHFEFDPRCRTAGDADIVFITSGLAWYQTDRIPYGEVGFGEDGGCFFGSYSRGNWPAGGLTIVGDTATVMLCATTQGRSRSDSDDKHRWGLKCTVRGLFGNHHKGWIAELGCSVANACSAIGDKLLRGLPQQNIEKACQPWTMQRQLFSFATLGCKVLNLRNWSVVDDIVKRSSRGEAFFSALAKYVRLRDLPSQYATAKWTESLQEAAAVLLLRSNRRLLAVWLAASVGNENTISIEDERSLFQRIAVELGKIERWMLRQVQLVSEWHYLCTDKVSLDELMERYADNLDRLSELCQLKGVPFKKNDMVGCVKSIHELLVNEIAVQPTENEGVCKQPSGSHEAVAEAVSTKACFLLTRWRKCIEYSDTYSQSVSDRIESRSVECLPRVGEFLRSTVSVSALEECSIVQSSRLESRLSGVAYCTEALTTLRTKEMAQFFVGRVLHTIPSSSLLQDDGVFAGCALADPYTLANMTTSLYSYAKIIEGVSEPDLPAFHAAALADFWNVAHSLDNTSSRVHGLERVAKLVLTLDGEINSDDVSRHGIGVAGGNDVSWIMDGREVRGQVYEIAWIMLRLLVEEIYEHAAAEEATKMSWKSSLESVFGELRVLYKYFAAKCGMQGEAHSPSIGQHNRRVSVTSPSSDQAIYRVLCTLMGKVKVLHKWPEAFGWWIQNAIDFVASPTVPFYFSTAGVRLLRYALEALGDAIFDLDVVLENPSENLHKTQKIALGVGIQKILLKRIGRIVSPLPSDVQDTFSQTSDSGNDSAPNHCVLIFHSEQASDKIVDATNAVGEPDVSALEIPVVIEHSKDATEKAVSDAVAECTAAVAIMKHPSVRCDGCNQSPLRGFRFKCFTCPNYDLCTTCYMNRTHNMDHPFVRLADTAGTGDLLQSRSKGGGIVPETSLVGSKPWKGNLLRVLLGSQGYVIYRFGSRHECCNTANALAQLGILVTVAYKSDVTNLDLLHDWESKVQLSFEPGSGRLSHRRSSGSMEKNEVKKAGRDVINVLNTTATEVNSKTRLHGRKYEDGRPLASEMIAVLRLIISSRPTLKKWRSNTLKILTEILEESPHQLAITTPLVPAQREAYFLTMGATQVLGGFRESFRIGGCVSLPSYAAGKGRRGYTGVVYSYAFGNDDIVIATVDTTPEFTRSGDDLNDDEVCFCTSTISEVSVISEIPLDNNVIQPLEPLAASFCTVVEQIYVWASKGGDEIMAEDDASLMRWELGCALMRSFSSMISAWPSLFDNQVISTNGNAPAILFQLAQMCIRDVKVGDIEDTRTSLWQMEWLRSRELHFSLATRPLSSSSFSACDEKTCVLRPPPSSSDEPTSFSPPTGDGFAQGLAAPSEYFYNLYAFSSRADLPQHSGRNKMLEYWEKNVIPAIETYVSGSFKSYEMDYFFAQLREPLREGHSAAALKIAFTLCDGHVPSGCHYPDPDTDWSALQIDDVEVGGRYVIACENVDVSGWPQEMLWTLGHSGAVRVVSPSGMVLLQVINPMTAATEHWWYHVESLRMMSSISSVSEQSVTDFDSSRLRLTMMNQQLIYCISRKCVFELLQVSPEHAMKLSIETRKTSLSRTSSSPFPLPASSSLAYPPPATSMQLAAPLPKDLENRYDLSDLLRLAAAADLGCPERVLSSEMGAVNDSTLGCVSENNANLYLRPKSSQNTALIAILQVVLNKQFERAAATPPPPVMDRSTSYDENASVMVTMPAKKHKKRGKQGGLAGKLAAASAGSGTSLVSSSSSSSSISPPSSSSSASKSMQPKLQQPEVTPIFSTRKYRYLLMESLLAELKASLDLSSAFLRSRSFMVTSDSPPQPLVLVHVPDATCLVLSFAVHPVLMDLPAGSSLEFFRDERCTDRLFGYFGDKRGLSYLPPLVVPGDRCYVRMSQGTYARYKFRVDALTADFGLALWICEEVYQKLLSVQLSHYEVETVLTTLLNALVEYLVATSACLPSNAKNAVHQVTAKVINFALSKGAMHAVPIAKLSVLVKELTFVYDNERTTQKGLYSLHTQQLAELISLVEEVSSLKGGSSSILGGAWWKDFVRMAVFTRVLAQGKREIATPDAFKRIYCGRAPIREIEIAHDMLASHDLFAKRIILLQNLPRTSQVAELETNISKFLVHLSLEECGEADDQNVYSAAAVTRFGIVADVLYLPVDCDGQTKGYALVDIGRADVIDGLLTRIPKESFEFDGGVATAEDKELLAKIEAVCRPSDGSSSKPDDGSNNIPGDTAVSDDVWACSVCTLENCLSDVECAACGSPIPPELANLSQTVQVQPQASATEPVVAVPSTDDAGTGGWPCPACTFVNSWSDTSCDACEMERSADLVPPPHLSSTDGNEAESEAEICQGDASFKPTGTGSITETPRYKLSAARFVEMIHVGDETGEVPAQVTEFLRHRLFQRTLSETNATPNDEGALVAEFRSILKREVAQYSTSSDSKVAVDAFAALIGLKKTRTWDSLPAEERLSELISTKALSKLQAMPLRVYKWMCSSGYDLQFELSHYASADDALQAQGKWTHQMDCQLIAACRELSGKIGVLTLAELCPSHLSAEKHAREFPLLASLDTRDLRLRFVILQALNKLLLAALPLVNLRPWSDLSSLRSRIVSIRQLIFPGVKIRFFAQTQDYTSLAHAVFADTNAKRPMVTIDRRKVAGKRGGLSENTCDSLDLLYALRDPKRSLFASTMKQLSAISPSLLRAKRPTGASDPFVSFIVIFAGENVVGEGGPYRQLFNDLSNELLASGNPLFIPTQNNVMKAGEFRERYIPKPSSTSKELLQMFEFVGLLMGCCLRTGVRLNLRLAPLVWKMLVKQSLVLADLESVDHSLCESLKFLEELASSPSEDPNEVLYDSFTTTLSDGTIVELKAGGHNVSVTKVNVKEYIRLVKATRLQECKPQVDAMLRGIGKIVPVQLLQLCVWSELQQWVSGSLKIDVELLKRHTRYSSGMSPEQFPHLEIFWKVLSGFSEENKRRFINFAWGQDTLPVDDAEFDRTHTRLLIKAPQGEGLDQDALLPKADTCFFNIELPVYSSEEIMRKKLLLAITLCTSLDGDDQTAGRMDIYYAGDEVDDDAME